MTATTSLSMEDADRFRSYERQRHDDLASSYHDFFSPVTLLAAHRLLKAVHIREAIDILDIATGPGSLAAEAKRADARPVGIDLSSGMIELAKKSYPGIDFRVADVEHLPFKDKAFDADFPYPEAAAAECVRVLKTGGRIALSWWDDPSKQRIQGLFRDAITEVGAKLPSDVPTGYSILRFADSTEFQRLLDGAGLTNVKVEDHQTDYLIPDVDTLWRGGMGSFAVTASAITHQDATTQAAIRAALERRAAVYMTPSGLILPVAFKIGSGTKQ